MSASVSAMSASGWSFRVIETMYIEAKHHVHSFGGARRPACREIVTSVM